MNNASTINQFPTPTIMLSSSSSGIAPDIAKLSVHDNDDDNAAADDASENVVASKICCSSSNIISNSNNTNTTRNDTEKEPFVSTPTKQR